MIKIENDVEAKALFEHSFLLEEDGNIRQSFSIRKRLVLYAPYEERFIIALARSYERLERISDAEMQFRKAIFFYPTSELSSLQLFHFLWNNNKKDAAFEEIKRFQSISHSDDYMEIVREINDKSASPT